MADWPKNLVNYWRDYLYMFISSGQIKTDST